MLPFSRHWWTTPRTCVWSTQPAMSTPPSETTCASVASTGAVVITGRADADAASRAADPLRDAVREVVAVAGREPRRGRRRAATASTPPHVLDVLARPQLLEVLREARAASVGESTTTTTFSWRVNESFVQFIEPVQTLAPSRTTYLWCIRSGMPATAFPLDRQRRDQLHVGLRRRRHRDRVAVVDVVGEADSDPARGRAATASAMMSAPSPATLKSYCARSSVSRAPSRNAAIQPATSAADWPPSVRVRTVRACFVTRVADARIGSTYNFYRNGARAPLLRARLERVPRRAGARAGRCSSPRRRATAGRASPASRSRRSAS